MTKTYKGIYKPTNPKKYAGDASKIVYRSNWERRFMVYCDKNDDIIYWASEELAIPYYDSLGKRVRNYYPDFLIKIKNKDGIQKTHLIEVKPSKDLKPPIAVQGKKKSTVLYEMKTYLMNRDKFASAREWCSDRGIQFDIWTEKELL